MPVTCSFSTIVTIHTPTLSSLPSNGVQLMYRVRGWCGCGFVWRSVGAVVSRLRHEAVYIEMWWWAAACGRAGGGGGWIREVAAPIIIFIVVVGVMVVGGGRARVKAEGFECCSRIVGG